MVARKNGVVLPQYLDELTTIWEPTPIQSSPSPLNDIRQPSPPIHVDVEEVGRGTYREGDIEENVGESSRQNMVSFHSIFFIS